MLNISSKRYINEKIIKPLIKNNLLEYTNKTSINARNQKYITTKIGEVYEEKQR